MDSCSPDPSQTINSVPLPNTGQKTFQCQILCNGQTRKHCAYWSISCPQNPVETCTCTFYQSSYLHSCQKVGGDEDTDIEVILISNLKLGPKSKVVIPSKSEKKMRHKCAKYSFSMQLTPTEMHGTNVWQLWGSGGRRMLVFEPAGLDRSGNGKILLKNNPNIFASF